MSGLFLKEREPIWKRMESLLGRVDKRGLKSLTEDEIGELAHLYPSLVVDVARARALNLDETRQKYLNNLAIRGHGLLYRRKKVPILYSLYRFFRVDYPRLFRAQSVYLLLSALIFFLGGIGACASVLLSPSNAYYFFPASFDTVDEDLGLSDRDISDRYRGNPGATMSSGIIGNNITVAFNAFALGITAGLGTLLVLLKNGMLIGALAGHFHNYGLSYPFWSFITPHGALEIFAILIAGAAGLRIGHAVVVPGSSTRGRSLYTGAREAVFLVLGTIPLFVVAGIIEGFITPSTIPNALKIVLGVAAFLVPFLYLMSAGRTESDSTKMVRD